MSYKVNVTVGTKVYVVGFKSEGKTVLAIGVDAQGAARERMGDRPMLVDLTTMRRA